MPSTLVTTELHSPSLILQSSVSFSPLHYNSNPALMSSSLNAKLSKSCLRSMYRLGELYRIEVYHKPESRSAWTGARSMLKER
jgi:hypothetical protein